MRIVVSHDGRIKTNLYIGMKITVKTNQPKYFTKTKTTAT